MSNKTAEVSILGAGVFGLSLAHALTLRGVSCQILEKRQLGAGASGGILGALMPHVPEQWNPKKDFQFKALASLAEHAQALEQQTGLSTGYGRLGRIMPLTSEHGLKHAQERAAQAVDLWQTAETGFGFTVQPYNGLQGWLNATSSPFGVAHDTLAARLNPVDYCKALHAASKATLFENLGDLQIDANEGAVRSQTGETFRSQAIVIAAGYESFALITPYLNTAKSAGTGIKGQASLLKLAKPLAHPLPPVIYHDGIYIVPHSADVVAVGSTSEREWTHTEVDPENTSYVQTAAAFCPALQGAEVISHWAGVRPRARKRDPLLGQIEGQNRLYVMTGGFKISFGIAHRLAVVMADMVLEQPLSLDLPESFTLQHHLG